MADLFKNVNIKRRKNNMRYFTRLNSQRNISMLLSCYLDRGIVKTKSRLRETFWWPKMDHHVEVYVKNCVTCSEMDKTAKTHFAPLTPVPLPSAAWEKLAVDLVGQFYSAPYGQRFAITPIDYYSKWPEVHFCHTVTTKVIVNFLEDVFSRKEYLKEIVSDNGNGEVERFNKVLKNCVQAAILTRQNTPDALKTFLIAYRSTAHSVTRQPPSQLLHDKSVRTKLHVLPPANVAIEKDLRQRVEVKQQYMKKYADQRRRPKRHNFKCGDYVRV
ncbi:Uncharacterized protein T4E_6852 [Trichinella pseudospiralis]|uniref:RNA-directed DNA polymerase n=1 Tax=Trichinella pseudospiralis TaxID=6337 RepID=A0A0V0XFC6_TRIPS|nr:Uncharacterized protein T4E_6852 [Trichinella pseudospiralis]